MLLFVFGNLSVSQNLHRTRLICKHDLRGTWRRKFDIQRSTHVNFSVFEDTKHSQNRELMTTMSLSASVATEEISKVIEEKLQLGSVTSMTRSGASGWAVMHRATTDQGYRLFIKVSREAVSMFEGEAVGLNAMYATKTIRAPKVYHFGSLNATDGSYIIMEALELHGAYAMEDLGKNLAQMHLAEPVFTNAQNGNFGFPVNNTIGATLQPNGWLDDWVEFFKEKRLRHQALLTGDTNLIDKTKRLCARLDDLFEDVKGTVKPSLIHGDFWSGNVASVEDEPVIFDPACYYGHHEAEFGMIWCMQLNRGFWEGYRELIPKADGFDRRNKLYQLYHYLNHYNLFGGGYYGLADHYLTELINSLPSVR